jgi:hypothetical protein
MKSYNRLIIFILLSIYTINAASQEIQTLDWQIGYHKEEADQPDKWFKAQVPGAVQLDVMR